MQIELAPESQAKVEDILEQLATYYDLEDLTSEELIDALLDLGVDLMMPEEMPVANPRERFIAYCGRKVEARG